MYQCSLIRFARQGDRVVPLRIVKAWVAPPAPPLTPAQVRHGVKPGGKMSERRFVVVRSTLAQWPGRDYPDPHPPAVKVAPMDRARLIELGMLKPAGVGPYLAIDDATRAKVSPCG